MLRTGLASILVGLTIGIAGCGGGGSRSDDPIRFSSRDVQAHFKQKTGVTLAVLANDSKAVDILGPPDQKAIERYGSFTVNVAKNKGAIKAVQTAPLGTIKRFENVVVEWLSTKGEDRAPYERSLAVFSSLGK